MQALSLIADIIDSVTVVLMLLLMVNWSFAEAAWLALLLLSYLLTGHSNMIWCGLAVGAECFLTFIASDSMSSHILTRFLAHDLTLVIFGLVVNLPRLYFHLISTGALGQLESCFGHELFKVMICNLILLRWIHDALHLNFVNVATAIWAAKVPLLHQSIIGCLPEALKVHHVEAVRCLKEELPLFRGNIAIAEFADIWHYLNRRCWLINI